VIVKIKILIVALPFSCQISSSVFANAKILSQLLIVHNIYILPNFLQNILSC